MDAFKYFFQCSRGEETEKESTLFKFCTIKKEGHSLRFIAKITKGQFRLQMIILHEGPGVNFKTSIFSRKEFFVIAIRTIWTTKGAIVTSLCATGENYRHLYIAMLYAVGDVQCKTR